MHSASVLDRLAQLEDELLSLRQQLPDQLQAGSLNTDMSCGIDPHCHWWQPQKLRGGVEVLWVKPRLEDGAEEDSATNVLDFHLDATPRIWLELLNANDKGVRARYWHFTEASRSSSVSHIPLAGNENQMLLDAYTIDLEAAKHVDWDDWQFTLGTGIRYAWLEQQVRATDTGDFVLKRFNAIGPMVSLETCHPIGQTIFTWVANMRASILVGESDWRTSSVSQTTDDIGAIFEMQIGLESHFCRNAFGELFVRVLWEQQHWFGAGTHFSGANTVGNGIFGIQPDDYDMAFMGFGIAVGLLR
ncbi:MAG: hypothetical protein GTO53_13775 [Planctomycetales bacterium]|nr:hypothetical protein [Planctomycetales bacterium]NIM10157.1 hypothetical protein [Planctomycetales bacterium]NIN78706.1 hypothetical protein [Planctomycetales bacterium]NIO35883.1 hypothetical protein [Planctomycetales bacterium]NIP71207.1 hypothetical protein [Planctomycetales bacterium]